MEEDRDRRYSQHTGMEEDRDRRYSQHTGMEEDRDRRYSQHTDLRKTGTEGTVSTLRRTGRL